MSKYFYIARNRLGEKVSGIEDATTEEELISRIQARNLIVINVTPDYKEGKVMLRPEGTDKPKIKHQHYRVTGSDLVLFCRQLATLLGAGVTILRSLEIIAQQVSSRRFYTIIKDLQRSMEKGLSFHEAMAKHSAVFSDLWINLVESGEASGNLAIVLNRLAGYFERTAAFKRKIISALIYPMILLFASTGALLFMTIKIIPAFAEIFKGMNIALPLLTRILIAASVFLREKIFLIMGAAVVVIYLFKRYINTKGGRKRYEKFKFRLPVMGEFFHAIAVERFSSEMSTLLESGVPILYSFEISEHSVGNPVTAEIIRGIKDDVRDGKPLIEPFDKCGFFEPMVVQMIGIGEEIGELPQMFKKINAFYQEYTETFLSRIISLFEPAILLFMGAIIGIIVIGVFLPIFQITQISG